MWYLTTNGAGSSTLNDHLLHNFDKNESPIISQHSKNKRSFLKIKKFTVCALAQYFGDLVDSERISRNCPSKSSGAEASCGYVSTAQHLLWRSQGQTNIASSCSHQQREHRTCGECIWTRFLGWKEVRRGSVLAASSVIRRDDLKASEPLQMSSQCQHCKCYMCVTINRSC